MLGFSPHLSQLKGSHVLLEVVCSTRTEYIFQHQTMLYSNTECYSFLTSLWINASFFSFSNFKKLSCGIEYLTLNGTTLNNLEILQNQVRKYLSFFTYVS